MNLSSELLSSKIKPEALYSQFAPSGIIGRLFNFPLMRIFIILLFLAPIMMINSVVVFQVIEKLNEPIASYIDLARVLITIPLFILSYRFYCQIIEKRDAVEVSLKGALKQWLMGAATATLFVLSFVFLIALVGDFTIIETRPFLQLVTNFFNFSIGSFLQEFILLCVIYRLVEEMAGSWIALFTSILLFSGIHILNENENLTSVAMLMLSSIIFIAPFILTRRIWLSWGFHAGWNFMQAGVFGMANSGIMFKGWLVTQISGPEWITGGAVGLEASYLSVAIDLTVGVIILNMAIRAGQMVPPRWTLKTAKIENAKTETVKTGAIKTRAAI